jgi:membrane protein DedA with SNARE-associated domain
MQMNPSLLSLTELQHQVWPYILLFFLVALEGPIVTLAAAVASSAGYMDPKLVFVSASCGNMSADILWYSLGYLGKLEWIERYGKWIGMKRDMILRLKNGIDDHIGKLLFVAKLTLGLVVPTLVAAGLARVPWKRWIGVLLLTEGIWTGSLVVAGYYYGQYIQSIETGLRWVSICATIIIISGLAFYFLWQNSHKDKI